MEEFPIPHLRVAFACVLILHEVELAYFFSLATDITRKSFKIFTVKQEKHDAIKLLIAQSKLHSINLIISQAMQYGGISSIEFHKALQEVHKYRKLKADIRNQVKTKVRHIAKEQRKKIASTRKKERQG